MSNKFIWTEKYGVGIQLIDEQHKHFFEIVNKILDLVDKESKGSLTRRNVSDLLDELGNYALYHLGTEEGYFDALNYPDVILHISSHNKYRETIKKYLNRVIDEKEDVKKLLEEAASYSGNWLSQHILETDKKYTIFFNEHGLK